MYIHFQSPPRSATIPYDPRSKTSGFASNAVGNDVSFLLPIQIY